MESDKKLIQKQEEIEAAKSEAITYVHQHYVETGFMPSIRDVSAVMNISLDKVHGIYKALIEDELIVREETCEGRVSKGKYRLPKVEIKKIAMMNW